MACALISVTRPSGRPPCAQPCVHAENPRHRRTTDLSRLEDRAWGRRQPGAAACGAGSACGRGPLVHPPWLEDSRLSRGRGSSALILAWKSWIRTQGQAGVGKLSPTCPPAAHGPFAAAPAVWSWEQRSLRAVGTLHPPPNCSQCRPPSCGPAAAPSPARAHSCFSEDPGFSAAPLDHKCLAGRACAFLSLTPAKPGARQCSWREHRAAASAPALLPDHVTCSRPAPCQSSEPELFRDSCPRLGEALDCASNPR